MSTAPLVRDPDLSRLLDDGYDVVVQEGHLIVRHIPVATAAGNVELGFLTYPVTVSGDRIVSGTDHRIWFGGAAPCDESGRALAIAVPEQHAVTETLQAQYMLSSKPGPEGYPDEYAKVTTYVRIVSHPALALDPSATATPGAAWQEVADGQPFHYRDTASSRAGLALVNSRYLDQRVAVIGLGGTGSYIADLVVKTPVQSVLLVDGDTFDNHNAFRAPGAATLEELRSRPNKADYFAAIYSRMHQAVTAAPCYLDEDNLALLDGVTFVFLASDDPTGKAPIIDWLERHDIPFLDVGMGVDEVDGKLTGLLRVTTSLPGRRDVVRNDGLVSGPAAGQDDYGRNIQTADLNALNAALAVIRWKRHIGCYADLSGEAFTTYSITTNELANEDLA